eukprot:COSAG02_NODE_2765_length_8068_cov_6.824319_10_plen_62_part_00
MPARMYPQGDFMRAQGWFEHERNSQRRFRSVTYGYDRLAPETPDPRLINLSRKHSETLDQQ